jgi:hypothetical protein
VVNFLAGENPQAKGETMTMEEMTDEELVEAAEENYQKITDFLAGLEPDQRAEVFKESMLAFVYHLSNARVNPELQFKVLFASAIAVGAERAKIEISKEN